MSPQPKRRRVPDATVQAVALEQQLPLYAVGRQWSAGLGGSHAGADAARSARPFSSLLLAPAALLEPPPAAPGAGRISAALRWQLLPGGGAVSGHVLRRQRQQAGGVQQQAPAEAQSGGAAARYFGAPAAQQGSGGERAYWQRQYDDVLQERPENDELWLSYAVRHAVEADDGSGCALTPGALHKPGPRPRSSAQPGGQGAQRPQRASGAPVHCRRMRPCVPQPSNGMRRAPLPTPPK